MRRRLVGQDLIWAPIVPSHRLRLPPQPQIHRPFPHIHGLLRPRVPPPRWPRVPPPRWPRVLASSVKHRFLPTHTAFPLLCSAKLFLHLCRRPGNWPATTRFASFLLLFVYHILFCFCLILLVKFVVLTLFCRISFLLLCVLLVFIYITVVGFHFDGCRSFQIFASNKICNFTCSKTPY
ncbi:hypothetical protein RchiOBHm_Chr5g0028071 [Rosa chinensis]|uniref:Uncharacterized protein n=1 Tax=Rosa chinensis TaxID=74649 RepID=A0A2P6Q9B3_ROSCH|nr:hypothetical protein RchiOBHm_Chr5g0028071 [Rosa chinensis]